MSEPSFGSGFIAGQYAIDGYGTGGFHFGHVSHRGSILMVPDGVHIWPVSQFSEINADSLAPVFTAAPGTIDLLLIGTGMDLVPVPPALRAALKAIGIVAEPMATAAAARTYNILLGERRRVACALIAVA